MPQNKEEQPSTQYQKKKIEGIPEREKIYEVKYTSTFVKSENEAQNK